MGASPFFVAMKEPVLWECLSLKIKIYNVNKGCEGLTH